MLLDHVNELDGAGDVAERCKAIHATSMRSFLCKISSVANVECSSHRLAILSHLYVISDLDGPSLAKDQVAAPFLAVPRNCARVDIVWLYPWTSTQSSPALMTYRQYVQHCISVEHCSRIEIRWDNQGYPCQV